MVASFIFVEYLSKYDSYYFAMRLLSVWEVDTVLSNSISVLNRVNRSAFMSTEMELSAIAAAAIIGFKNPNAASGIPRQL